MYGYVKGNTINRIDKNGLFFDDVGELIYDVVCRLTGWCNNEQIENAIDTCGQMMDGCAKVPSLGPLGTVTDAATNPKIMKCLLNDGFRRSARITDMSDSDFDDSVIY